MKFKFSNPIFLFKHSMEKIDKQKDFSVDGILDMTCNITTFQDGYFVNSSFETAKAQLRSEFIIR